MISIIVAMSPNRLIGRDNELPWGHMPADLQHFKKLTMSKPVLMGRKTFDSIGKPLPGRRNIIITRQKDLIISGCEVVNSLEAALQLVSDNKEVVVIGGAEIFKLALPQVKRLYITFIDYQGEGDTYFPEWSSQDWRLISEKSYKADEKNPYSYRFCEYVRE